MQADHSLINSRFLSGPWVRKIPWRWKWQTTPVFLAGKSHGQRSLVGYSPWKRKSLSRVWLFCNPMNCSLPGSSAHGISQARILEWVAISFSRDLPYPGLYPSLLHWQADSLPLGHKESPPKLAKDHWINYLLQIIFLKIPTLFWVGIREKLSVRKWTIDVSILVEVLMKSLG